MPIAASPKLSRAVAPPSVPLARRCRPLPSVGLTVEAEEERQIRGVAKCRHGQCGHARARPRPDVGDDHGGGEEEGRDELGDLGAGDEAAEGEAAAENLGGAGEGEDKEEPISGGRQ